MERSKLFVGLGAASLVLAPTIAAATALVMPRASVDAGASGAVRPIAVSLGRLAPSTRGAAGYAVPAPVSAAPSNSGSGLDASVSGLDAPSAADSLHGAGHPLGFAGQAAGAGTGATIGTGAGGAAAGAGAAGAAAAGGLTAGAIAAGIGVAAAIGVGVAVASNNNNPPPPPVSP